MYQMVKKFAKNVDAGLTNTYLLRLRWRRWWRRGCRFLCRFWSYRSRSWGRRGWLHYCHWRAGKVTYKCNFFMTTYDKTGVFEQ